MCLRGKAENDGWCTGDSLCPELGPLDFHDAEGNVVWNSGSPKLTDGYRLEENKKTPSKDLVIKGYFNDNDENEFQEDP